MGFMQRTKWAVVWLSAPTSALMSSTKRLETDAKAADLAPGRAPSAAAFSRAWSGVGLGLGLGLGLGFGLGLGVGLGLGLGDTPY